MDFHVTSIVPGPGLYSTLLFHLNPEKKLLLISGAICTNDRRLPNDNASFIDKL